MSEQRAIGLLNVNAASVVPNVTPVTPVKWLPVMVTTVPPAVEPDVRLRALPLGAVVEE